MKNKNTKKEIVEIKNKLIKLKKYNIIVGAILILQAILLLAISKAVSLPVMSDFIENFPTGIINKVMFNIRLDIMIATFLLLSGIFLVGSGSIWRKKYEQEIINKKTTFRWVEYSITATIMIVVIAMLSGVYNYGALIGIAFLNVAMIGFGYVMEQINDHGNSKKKVKWWPYIFGLAMGTVAWIPIFISFIAATSSTEGVPAFVYAVVYILFVMFMLFGIVIILQYRAKGKWKDYLYGEWIYITLSLTAKTTLAWIVFGGIMR